MEYGAHENGDTTVGHSCWAGPHKQPVYNSGSSVSPIPNIHSIYINPHSLTTLQQILILLLFSFNHIIDNGINEDEAFRRASCYVDGY